MMKQWFRPLCVALSAAALVSALSACAKQSGKQPAQDNTLQADSMPELTEEEALALALEAEVPMGSAPAISTTWMPSAPGTVVLSTAAAEMDASNTADGYVMIRYLKDTTARIKVLITGPSGTVYNYNLNNDGTYEVFPLSDGNGTYKIGVYQNIEGTRYSTMFSKSIDVTLRDEFAPFLLPNQYVNYTPESAVVAKAAELCKDAKTELDKVAAIYNYVVENFTYDRQLAATVQSGYLPDVDKTLESKTGICFDYAAVMTAMLRSQGVPTKLVVGYTGTIYHAWINTYSKDAGWVDGVIFFDGTSWKLMDPTFASTGNESEEIMNYIGNGTNYSAKYLY